MPLALFDLDNTLLAADSDYLWGVFLVEKNLVDKQVYDAANKRFYDEYKQGTLDIHEFLRFSLQPLTQHSIETLEALHREFMQTHIQQVMTEAGRQHIQKHKDCGDTIIIITATNRFITQPIADAFAADVLIATEPEIINGEYTGNVAGTPCFQSGKITRLEQWLQKNNQTMDESWFYSDSHNDLPLLEKVTFPVAVDPDDSLRDTAMKRGWMIKSFRD